VVSGSSTQRAVAHVHPLQALTNARRSARVQHCPSTVVFRNLEPAQVISANTCDPQKSNVQTSIKVGRSESELDNGFQFLEL